MTSRRNFIGFLFAICGIASTFKARATTGAPTSGGFDGSWAHGDSLATFSSSGTDLTCSWSGEGRQGFERGYITSETTATFPNTESGAVQLQLVGDTLTFQSNGQLIVLNRAS